MVNPTPPPIEWPISKSWTEFYKIWGMSDIINSSSKRAELMLRWSEQGMNWYVAEVSMG